MKAQKTKDVMKYLKSLGWVFLRDGQGSHEVWGLPDESVRASIPVGHREISPGVLRQIKNAGAKLPRVAVGRRPAMDTRTFEVVVEREGRWWVFEIPELGTGGQARSLAEVDYEAQGVAAMWLDVAPETVAVMVTVKGPEHALAEWTAAEREEAEAREAQARAAERRRAVVRELRTQGWTAPDASRVLGISKQRVYQLLNDRQKASA